MMNSELYLNDGVDHINAYSKSECELGRMLSNFYKYKLTIDGVDFNSLEAYWYYLLTNDISIASMSGNEAKQYGKTLTIINDVNDEFKEKFRKATELKINTIPNLKTLLLSNVLPITHYYVSENGKQIKTNHDWLPKMIMDIRHELNQNNFSDFFNSRNLGN